MSGKVGGPSNHLPIFPPMVPPPERPITTPAKQEGAPVKVRGKSRSSGAGSQKIGTHDPHPTADGGGVGKQLPDAVQQKPQEQGFTRQDSFRPDEVKQGALQQQTIGQGPRHKQSRMVRELTKAKPQFGFFQGKGVSGALTKGEARAVQRGGTLATLHERATRNSQDTVRHGNPFAESARAAAEVTQQVTAPAVNALSSLLQDSGANPVHQMNAAASLGQLKQPEASPALLEAAYGGARWEVREAAQKALAEFPEQAGQFVQQHFEQLSPEAQSGALDHLSRKPNEGAVQTFLTATDSADPAIRHKGLKKLESALMYERSTGEAVFGQGGALRQQVVNTAARLSRDPDPTVSAKAADLLYHL